MQERDRVDAPPAESAYSMGCKSKLAQIIFQARLVSGGELQRDAY